MPRRRAGLIVGLCIAALNTISHGPASANSHSITLASLTKELPATPKSSRIIIGDQTFLRPTYGSWKQDKYVYQAVLPICSLKSDEPCIEKVEVREGTGPWISGQPKRPIGHQEISFGKGNLINTWQGSESDLLPPGSEPFLWTLGKKHDGGSTYQVTAMFQKIKGDPGAGQFNLGITGLTDSQDPISCAKEGGVYLGFKSDILPPNSQAGICPIHYDLPEELEFKVAIKFGYLAKHLIGWMDSHTLNPKLEEDGALITFSGKPIKTFVMTSEVLTFDQIRKDSKLCEIYTCEFKVYNGELIEGMQSFIKYWKGNEQNWTALYRKVPSVMSDKSLQDIVTWGFSTSQYKINTYCKASQNIVGLISTNATIYNPAPPVWNAQSNSLNFEASAPHFQSDGQLTSGYYGVMLDAGFAKCLWKSNLINARAELEVIYQDGTSTISTTTLSSTESWVNFVASNFHFSSPKFALRIVPTKPLSESSRTKKIMCTKGKLTKSVSGSNPKCPSGYRQS
ncbi:hypothetical protein MCEMRE196_00385 [Candidatus Nanopelagicaceae bacterium]